MRNACSCGWTSHGEGGCDRLRTRSLSDAVKDRAWADVDADFAAGGAVREACLVVDEDGLAVPRDGLRGTLRDALAAQRAADHAGGAHDRLLVLGHARQLDAARARVELEQVLRAHGHAQGTAGAACGVDDRDSFAAKRERVEW